MFFLVDFDDISGGIGAFIKIFIIKPIQMKIEKK